MADAWKPVLVALAILFLVGFLLPLMVQDYITDETFQPQGVTADVINFVDQGTNFTIPIPAAPDLQFNFNIFSIFGDSVKDFVVQQFSAFVLIPNYIAIPLAILFIFSIVWIAKVALP